jgi:hypothetical protein
MGQSSVRSNLTIFHDAGFGTSENSAERAASLAAATAELPGDKPRLLQVIDVSTEVGYGCGSLK